MKLEAGAHVTPNVRLLRQLGAGGMGDVWVAEHLALGTEVAVKFLQGDYANDAAARARFSQEAAAASQVKSSHVVKIYDYGLTDTNVPFIVMEMLEGTDLAHRIQSEVRIPIHDVVTIVSQLCKALERAHEKGVVHRDIKPENIFLTTEGGDTFVKLLDFGIAKTDSVSKTTGSRRSTMAGESLGTPYYMSPEQFRSAKQIDFRTDLWSVGVLVYEALTGVLPFEAETVSALAIVVNDGKAAAPTSIAPSLPIGLDAWFAKACARDPNDRFQSARELSDALRVALGDEPPAARTSLTSEAPLPVPSDSHRVVVVGDAKALERATMPLRDTAFATSGGEPATAKPRRLVPIVAVAIVLVLSLLGAMAFWATRPKENAASAVRPAVSSPPAATTEVAPPLPTATTVASLPAASAAPAESARTSVSARSTKVAVPPPSASSPTKDGKHGDIW